MEENVLIHLLTTGKKVSIHLYVIALHFTMDNIVKHIFVLMKMTVKMAEFVLRKAKDVTVLMATTECNVNLKISTCEP